MYTSIPAISGKTLIKLLEKDGWEQGRKTRHAFSLTKKVGDHTLVAYVQNCREPLDTGTLHDILGLKQTKIGSDGLLALLNKYGL
jgi:predicted RNA binding protein YcfA (HicA-like mRNA interferase family)